MPQLTVIIPCKDEAHNIGDCIASVRPIADEIIVADSGSSDGTLEIVRQAGDCRIIEREYVNSADFKNWAIPHASHDWIMIVDADERPDPELVREINTILKEDPDVDAYGVRSTVYFLGHRIRYSGHQTVVKTRLFRKAVGRYAKRRVHSDISVGDGPVGLLQGRLDHYTCQCLNRFAQTLNRYSTWSALDMHEAGRTASILSVTLRPISRFLQFYLLRRGFLDGVPGLMICMMTAYYTFLKYSKLWEHSHSRTLTARSGEKADDNRTTDVRDYRTATAA